MKNFRDLFASDSVYVFDGAVGTRLYFKGIYINRSYDELNITNPDLVREVHEEYIAAGADIIETNSFGATRHHLQSYGLESKLKEINIAAVRIALEAAGDKVYVPVRSARWDCVWNRLARHLLTRQKRCTANRSRLCSRAG